jgi:hypothetical protein
MSYTLWEIGGSILNGVDKELNANAAPLAAAVHEHGLKVKPNTDGTFQLIPDAGSLSNVLGGAETDSNLRTLSNYLAGMRNFATSLTRAAFRHSILNHVQDGNRSVESALRNLNPGIQNMLSFMTAFMGKDVKHPLRFMSSSQNSTDYGYDPELIYSDEETGTYHTLQTLGENQAWNTWSTYLEDTPSVRRYLRYIDSIASRNGIRVVYCPKEFNHLDELSTPVRPTWAMDGERVVRQVRSDRYKLLFVSLTFDYGMFRDLTVIETDVQPGQRARAAGQMDFSPIFVDNLNAIVKVLTTLGSFAAWKIYYKDFRNSARSSQAVQSS